MYDSLPFELTVEIAQDNGLTVDEEGFKKEMNEQKERAKNAHVKISLTQNLIYVDIKKKNGETKFLGYEKDVEENCKVVAIVKDSSIISIEKNSVHLIGLLLIYIIRKLRLDCVNELGSLYGFLVFPLNSVYVLLDLLGLKQ